ncbi:ParB/RepB/Spo0J family partition protein [Candidatus Saccharibacteria bacterium]|nr:ParB/RepB/Spo0J family partition protein [Candidatus Saccharibacteria bacterium]
MIPTDFIIDEKLDTTSHEDARVTSLLELEITEITPDPDQPRKAFNTEELEELSDSIKEHGVLQPIMVVKNIKNTDGTSAKYIIVAGERRWRASRLAGLSTIPALVRELSDQKRLEVSIIENVQRSDLNPLEVATAYLKLQNQFNLSPDAIARKIGKSSGLVRNRSRLVALPESVKDAVISGKMTEGQARPLISVDPKIIEQILPRILKENWPARKIEQLAVQRRSEAGKKLDKSAKLLPYEDEVIEMDTALKAKTTVATSTRGSGSITIRFRTPADFRRIFNKITGKKD